MLNNIMSFKSGLAVQGHSRSLKMGEL